MITGIWQHRDGDLIALQFDEDEIVTVDYTFDPPLHTPVEELGAEWIELHNPTDSGCVPIEQT